MARFARAVAPGIAHHVTQRGNARRFILNSESDRDVYLNLLREAIDQHGASLIGYCLMSNHVHLVIVPRRDDSLAQSLKQTHGRYAAYWNAKYSSSGHVWQARYYSCPLDGPHLWTALRYTEMSPVRAGLVAVAEAWNWASAPAHCGARAPDGWLAMDQWSERWNVSSWRRYLAAEPLESEIQAIRQSTHTGRPLGSEEFVRRLEQSMQRPLAPRKAGRPKGLTKDQRQGELVF